MDFELPAPDDPRRAEVRAWIADHPHPSGADLARAGYVAPHWPRPYGLGADPVLQLVIDDELARAGIERPFNPIGIGWAGPTLLAAGTEAQQARWLPPMLAGDEFWCQLFSEPDAGSDLANVRIRATRDGDEWVVSGSKIWNTWAERSDWGILIARTGSSDPGAAKYKGISYFVVPMRTPGIEARLIVEMSGGTHFCEVFFDGVRLPADSLVGQEGAGWRLANITLANERVSLATGGVLWGMGPTNPEFFDLVARQGGIADPVLRQRAARVYTEAKILELLGYRALTAAVQGATPGPEVSVRKALADEHGQRLMGLAKDLAGTDALRDDAGPLGADVGEWHWGFCFSPALTIGGGTAQVQRNILGERVLGLPREPG